MGPCINMVMHPAPICWCLCILFFKVQAVDSTAMTGVQEPDLCEQRGEPPEEDGDEEEEGEKVDVSVEAEEEKDELPYPSLAPVVLLALTQTSPPRSWCLRAVCHPYLCQATNVRVSVSNMTETLSVCVSALHFLKGTVTTRHPSLNYFTFKHKEDGKKVCVVHVHE